MTLQPGAVVDVLGVPAHELAGQAIPLQEFLPDVASKLLEQLTETSVASARLSLVSAELVRQVRDTSDGQRRARAAVRLLLESGGHRTVADVAEAVELGERRLQQLFHTHVGLTPRAFRRLARLHACVRALRSMDTPRWAAVATDLGFYDQAHLVKEFRALSGLTPAAFFARTLSGSSNTAA